MQVRVLHIQPTVRGTCLVLAVLLVFSNSSAQGSDAERTLKASQALKTRIEKLHNDEEYLASFGLSIERLELVVPPTDANRDEFIDALTDMVFQTTVAGKLTLA